MSTNSILDRQDSAYEKKQDPALSQTSHRRRVGPPEERKSIGSGGNGIWPVIRNPQGNVIVTGCHPAWLPATPCAVKIALCATGPWPETSNLDITRKGGECRFGSRHSLLAPQRIPWRESRRRTMLAQGMLSLDEYILRSKGSNFALGAADAARLIGAC